jgi:heat shock protein HslJ
MKHLTLAAALFMTLSANTCKNGSGPVSVADTKWVLQTLQGSAVKMPEGVEQPWLRLSGDQLSGFGGCNQLMGAVELVGDKLKFPGVGSTKMYCEATQTTENAFTSVLNQVDSFKLDGGTLKLLGAGKELATLVKGE